MSFLLQKRISLANIMEWSATACLLISVALTAFDIFPINAILGLIANCLWVAVGIGWRRYSIMISSSVVCFIYAIGLIKHFATM